MWPSRHRAGSKETQVSQAAGYPRAGAGKRKKIELCAARRIEARGSREQVPAKVHLDGEEPATAGHRPFFTESLILAQNERWRRV